VLKHVYKNPSARRLCARNSPLVRLPAAIGGKTFRLTIRLAHEIKTLMRRGKQWL